MALATLAVAMMAQDPVITFDKTTHDFGKINEADGRVTTIFTFTNQGMWTHRQRTLSPIPLRSLF